MTSVKLYEANKEIPKNIKPSKDGISENKWQISNKTHCSITDPDATLAFKSGTLRSLKYKAHVCLSKAKYRGLDNVQIQAYMSAIAINIKRLVNFLLLLIIPCFLIDQKNITFYNRPVPYLSQYHITRRSKKFLISSS